VESLRICAVNENLTVKQISVSCVMQAMCLWYNMTKHHRLKMIIIGKLMCLHQLKNYNWPQIGPFNEDDPNVSSGVGTDVSDDNSYHDFHQTSRYVVTPNSSNVTFCLYADLHLDESTYHLFLVNLSASFSIFSGSES